MKRENKITSPSVPVNMRAFWACDPNEFMVVAAIQAIHWVKDADEEAGLDMLCLALPKMPRRTIQRALASLKASGLVIMERGYGRPSTFGLAFEDLSFRDFRATLHPRHVGANDDAKLAQTSRQVGADIISTDSKRQTEEKTTANAGAPSKLIKVFCEEHTNLKSSTYRVSGKDAGQAKLVQDYDEAWFRPAARAYLSSKDAFVAEAGFTLSLMLAQLNKWASKGSGTQGKRGCRHTDCEITERRGDTAAHKCKACGVVTWK
jgi:hypothetical protein